MYSKCIEADENRIACISNRSLCFLKLSRFQEVIDDCSLIIKEQPKHIKALFRRSQVPYNFIILISNNIIVTQ